MTRTVVLPSRDSPTVGEIADGESFHYVEDWFEYDQFDEAYARLLEIGRKLPDDSPFRAHGIDLWRVFFRSFFVPSKCNFKYLYPVARNVSELVDESDGDVVFVWPTEDYVTRLVRQVGKARDTRLTVRSDPSQRNPIPREYYGDDWHESSGLDLVTVCKAFGILAALHLLLLFGQLFPQRDPGGTDVIYADEGHRELTDRIRETDSVVTTTLSPRLLGPIRALASGHVRQTLDKLFDSEGQKQAPAVEDVLGGFSLTVAPYVTLFRLVRSQKNVADHLRAAVAEDGFAYLPDSYIEQALEESLFDRASLKYLAYVSIFDGFSGASTFTSVSGGKDQEFLFEMGRAFDTETVDLNHSVLMSEPTELRNRADTVPVKGHPDMERLQAETEDKNLVLTGRPYNDKLYERFDEPVTADIPALLTDEKRVVTVATEPIRDEHIVRVLQGVFGSELVEGICIKLHPKETKATYRDLLNDVETEATPYCLVYDEYGLFDLVASSDVLVTGSSNVGLEALMFGVPGLHAKTPPNVPLHYQTDDYFQQFMMDVSAIADTVDRYLSDGLDTETIAEIRELYLVDGNASDRLIEKVYRRDETN